MSELQAEKAGGYIPLAPRSLSTTGFLRAEMSKVYKDVRTRRIPASEGTKLAYILMAIARIIEGAEMERRVELLEQQLTGNRGVVIYDCEQTIEDAGTIPA
jgi:hypothetical protein